MDVRGRPLQRGYTAFVYVSQCEIEQGEDGRRYYLPQHVPAIPLAYGATWYGYGNIRKVTTRLLADGLWYDGVLYRVYASRPIYFLGPNRRVYTANSRCPIHLLRDPDRDIILARMSEDERADFLRTEGRFIA